MPRNRKKNRHGKKHAPAKGMAQQADQAVRRAGMDIHAWKQNVLLEPTLRIVADSNTANYHYFLVMDANGWTHRVYSRAPAGGDFSVAPILVNQGFTAYGDYAT